MRSHMNETNPGTFSPCLRSDDIHAQYWMNQVTVRLRREICWLRHEHGMSPETSSLVLPPFVDSAVENLGMNRNWEKKKHFFKTDPTARYLSDQLKTDPPLENKPMRGSFGWVTQELDLDQTASFVLALGLTVSFDNAVGSIIAVCLNDPAKTRPSLALAQKLWDKPEQVLMFSDPAHVLFQYGLIQSAGVVYHSYPAIDWESPIFVPSHVVRQLLFPNSPLPEALDSIGFSKSETEDLAEDISLITPRMNLRKAGMLRIIPLCGARGAAYRDTCRQIVNLTGREVVELTWNPAFGEKYNYLKSTVAYCWLRGFDLFLCPDVISYLENEKPGLEAHMRTLRSIPINLFLGISDQNQAKHIPDSLILPMIHIPRLSYYERVELWKNILGEKGTDLEKEVSECSRRFRFEKETTKKVALGLKNLPRELKAKDFLQSCRNELELNIEELAQKVTPRFDEEKLILPHKQRKQFEEILRAMRSLTEVHYGWGTARVWNEGGISALFAGPPGTGKTMAAEILAIKLDLPMYRIDLSQVINKYIGETEKNLKKLFDGADISDIILFFDEADSLFGRRTEVKDAHDRYANLEISYLLERMERFKGLAILATNRKKDLDEAFLRRLRFIIDFPLPGEEQRKRIWRQVIPKSVDCSKIDIDFLAKKFPLTGGHIRSIIFNACLQSVNGSTRVSEDYIGQLEMEQVIQEVKREYDKLNRPIGLEHFGSYSNVVKSLEGNNEKP